MALNSSCAVVIPLYRKELSELEHISLARSIEVWGETYDTIVLCPESLDLSELQQLYPTIQARRVADDAMLSIAHYNRLLLSRDFYALFSDYSYILIYQTDCYVFSDNLAHWIAKGYDYVGAPWHITHCPLKRLVASTLRRLRLYHTSWFMFNEVGNGGFSLRKVSAFLRHLDSMPKMSSRAKRGALNEDIYWSMEARELTKPSYHEAAHFCADMTPRHYPDDVMAVHGWNKSTETFEFWAEKINI